MPTQRLCFVPYRSKTYEYADFSSGTAELDDWLQHHAGQGERSNRTRTYLLVEQAPESRQIYGYFSLVNCQIEPQEAALVVGRPQRYPMAATLLARLAVTQNAQGQGLGGLLVAQAMKHTLAALEFAGSELLIVDAIDNAAVRFYQRFGLKLLESDGKRLFLPTRKIAASLEIPQAHR